MLCGLLVLHRISIQNAAVPRHRYFISIREGHTQAASKVGQMQIMHLHSGRMECLRKAVLSSRLPHQQSTAVASCSYTVSARRLEGPRQYSHERCFTRRQGYSHRLSFVAGRHQAVRRVRAQARQEADDWASPGQATHALSRS